ncbi:MAG: hypothetical protein E6I16_11185 [Chloroflexi bacterium]|nr:MAG: hypothetical protein E6I16_11185 [Chloroflexota bacterium]
MSSDQHPVVTAADEAFVAAFHAHQLSNEGFHHRDHLRLAWVQIRRLGLEQAAEVVTNGIRRFASHHGSAERYNDTMTRFWLRVVAIGIRRHPEVTFDELLAAEPHLLDKNLPFKHWSRERMNRDDAKQRWIEPDLRPMPAA